MDVILFLAFAVVSVVCAINLVLQRHPINSALSLIGVMGSLAVLYLLLGAEFIAAVQVIVYAGAIMVLFVFTIMLLNAGAEPKGFGDAKFSLIVSIPVLLAFLGIISMLIMTRLPSANSPITFGGFQGGGVKELGMKLFTQYLLPFEVTSILILIAILGAIVLAHKEID